MDSVNMKSGRNKKYQKITINNPFIRDKVTWDRDNKLYDKIKTAVLTVLLLPIRIFTGAIFLLLSWFCSVVAIYGLTDQNLSRNPIKGWRRIFCHLTRFFYRAVHFCMGAHWVKVKGKQEAFKKAPILVFAPHASFFDALLVLTSKVSPLVSYITRHIPIYGYIAATFQPIYVNNKTRELRARSIKDILDRVNSSKDWPQLLISPEGILTNGKQLIHFKLGAFYPGLPVQPILLRYPNKSDTLTHTLWGPHLAVLLWKTLAQFHNFVEIEYLPVYNPSDEEIADPKLYEKNVQRLMAEALNLPIADYDINDGATMKHARDCGLKFAHYIADILRLRRKLGVETSLIEEYILKQNSKGTKNHFIEFEEFVQRLKIPANDISFTLFSFFTDSDEDDVIDFKEYLLHALFLIKIREAKIEHVKLMFLLYGDAGRIQLEAFKQILSHFLKLPTQKIADLFTSIDTHESGFITFEDFRAATEKDKRFDKLYSMMTYGPQESTNH